MANDHAKDRYDPPKVGSEFDKEYFGEINIGEFFRLNENDSSKTYRKVAVETALDIKEVKEITLQTRDVVYVKS